MTQYDIEILQKIESLIGQKLEEYGKNGEIDTKAALILSDSVTEATRIANMEMRQNESSKTAGGADEEDDNQEHNADMKLFGKKRKHQGSMHNKGFGNKSFARKKQRKF